MRVIFVRLTVAKSCSWRARMMLHAMKTWFMAGQTMCPITEGHGGVFLWNTMPIREIIF